MFRKIASVCFSVLVFSGLFFAAQSDGFAQMIKYREYESTVLEYQSFAVGIPQNETQYQEFRRKVNDVYEYHKNNLTETHLKKSKYYSDSKRYCEKRLTGRNKNQCVQNMDAEMQKDGAEYVDALKKLGKVFEDKVRKLNEARKKFTPSEMKRTPQRRTYKRRF